MHPLASHRQTPRVDPQGGVCVLDVHAVETALLVDLSLGGFLIRSRTPYQPATCHDFIFESRDERWTTRLRARVVHSHQRAVDADGEEYLTGFAFLDADLMVVEARIHMLFEHALSAISFIELDDADQAATDSPGIVTNRPH